MTDIHSIIWVGFLPTEIDDSQAVFELGDYPGSQYRDCKVEVFRDDSGVILGVGVAIFHSHMNRKTPASATKLNSATFSLQHIAQVANDLEYILWELRFELKAGAVAKLCHHIYVSE